jgi:hypothetical protein
MEYAGAVYHVMSRGNAGQAIFENDEDRRLFLETMGDACNGAAGASMPTF